eukprot:5415814-Alexandrium_andersonii.AAC.1
MNLPFPDGSVDSDKRINVPRCNHVKAGTGVKYPRSDFPSTPSRAKVLFTLCTADSSYGNDPGRCGPL